MLLTQYLRFILFMLCSSVYIKMNVSLFIPYAILYYLSKYLLKKTIKVLIDNYQIGFIGVMCT